MRAKNKNILPGDRAEDALLARMLRVNQAGEYGAQRIYAGQLAVLKGTAVEKEIRHMAMQEDAHLAAFNNACVDGRVRPTLLQPLWHVAGFALGAGTALLGPKAAMACTVAVEEVIIDHYAAQLALLKKRGLHKKHAALMKQIERFMAEEDAHRALGVQHKAHKATGYKHLRALIRRASQTAIWLSERV